MNSPNAQKFIVSFLILAALTSSSVFFLFDNQNTGNTTGNELSGATVVSLDGQKVFVENIPIVPSYNSPLAGRSDISLGSGSNFTDYVTDKLATSIITTNPKGPVIKNGVPNLDLPKNLAEITDISGLLPGSFAPAIDAKKVSLLKDYTTEDVVSYLENSRSALQDNLASGLNDLTKASLSADSLASISAVYDQTEGKIYNSKVPAPLKNFNTALLGFVNSQRVFFNQEDPIKALVAIQNPQLALGKYQADLQNEVKNLEKSLPQIIAKASDNQTGDAYAVLHALLGVEKAHALLPDIIGGISNILNYISKTISDVWGYAMKVLQANEWLRKLLTEVVKDQVIHKLMQQITNWVQGGGDPQFVSDWKGFLGDAANVAAGGILQKAAPFLCKSFGPLVTVSLLQVDSGPSVSSNPYGCTLDQVVANVDQFRNNFENGGWIAYGQLLKPQNNFFGSFVQLNSAQFSASAQARESAQSEGASGGGFKSAKECKPEKTLTYDQPEQLGGISTEADARAAMGSGFISATCPGGGKPCTKVVACDSGGWSNTTPGGLIANTTNQISESPVGRIVNANDLVGLATAIANTALSKLMTSAKKGLSGLTATELNKPSDPNANCNGLSGTDLTACKSLNDQISKNGSSAGSGKEGVLAQLKKLLQLQQQILIEGSKTVSKAQEALSYVQIASSSCSGISSSTAPDAQETLAFISNSKVTLDENISNINDLMTGISGDSKAAAGSDAALGTLKRLDAVIKMVEADKIDDLAAMFDIPVLGETADPLQKKDDFYSKFANAVDTPSSAFGRIFGSLDSVGESLGNIKTFITTVSIDGSCGILERAKLLYQLTVDDKPACSIKTAEKTCRSGNY